MPNILPVEYTFECTAEGDTGEWLVMGFELDEALSEPYVARIHLAQHEDHSGDQAAFLGASCTLIATRGDAIERRQCGIISRVAYRGRRRDYQLVDVEVRPALYALSQRSCSRIFQEKDAKEILQAVLEEGLGDYDRSVELGDLKRTFPKREFTVQHRETDLAFAQRLMEEEGIGYYFAHSGEAEKLVLFDSIDVLPVCETIDGGEIPILGEQEQLPVETIAELSWRFEMRPTSVVVRDFDWTQPDVDLTRESRETDALGRDREIYVNGSVSTIGDYSGTSFGAEDGQYQADLRREAQESRESEGSGRGNVINIRPGVLFEIVGHGLADLDDKYVVTRAHHTGTAAEGHLPGLALEGADYRNRFSCEPSSRPHRPARRFGEPRILGPQTATVVGPAGEEVFTDEHGRIKVQFHWDREGAKDEHSSCFVRVAQTWAGQGYGTVYLPRIGMEVVVHFIDGHPDRPLVTGALYNGQNPTAYPLPDEKTKSTLYTNSSIGGGGHNELTLEDASGSEQIYVHAQKDWNTDVNNDMNTWIGANQDLDISANRTKHVAGNQDQTVDGNDDTTISGNRTLTLSGDDTSTISGNRTLTLSGNDDDTTGGNVTTAISGNDTLSISGNQTVAVSGSENISVGGTTTITVGGGNTWIETVLGPLQYQVHADLTSNAGSVKKDNASGEDESLHSLQIGLNVGAWADIFLGCKLESFAGLRVNRIAATQHTDNVAVTKFRSGSKVTLGKKDGSHVTILENMMNTNKAGGTEFSIFDSIVWGEASTKIVVFATNTTITKKLTIEDDLTCRKGFKGKNIKADT